jgi:hypothetical protein
VCLELCLFYVCGWDCRIFEPHQLYTGNTLFWASYLQCGLEKNSQSKPSDTNRTTGRQQEATETIEKARGAVRNWRFQRVNFRCGGAGCGARRRCPHARGPPAQAASSQINGRCHPGAGWRGVVHCWCTLSFWPNLWLRERRQ